VREICIEDAGRNTNLAHKVTLNRLHKESQKH
jgi:hypothetical protein